MSKHVSYRGVTIDMDSMRRENENVIATGNMGVNAKGDKVKNGVVTKTAEEMARERGRVQSLVVNTGLKGPVPEAPASPIAEAAKETKPKAHTKKTKETELPSKDIVVENDNGTQS